MSIFLKIGSDATTASIRIARAYANRIKAMRCGCHGWHDRCVEMKGGIPQKFYMEEPKPGFLEGVREIATKYGAILGFDEIGTCFRLRMGGAQELYGVTPDLTALGIG